MIVGLNIRYTQQLGCNKLTVTQSIDNNIYLELTHTLEDLLPNLNPDQITSDSASNALKLVNNTYYILIKCTQETTYDLLLRHSINLFSIIKPKFYFKQSNSVYVLTEHHKTSLRVFVFKKQGHWVKMIQNLTQAVMVVESKGICTMAIDPDNLSVNDNKEIMINYIASSFTTKINYLSPETLHFQEWTPESNVWTIGCLLVFLFTGRDPFEELEGFNDLKYGILDKNNLNCLLQLPELEPIRNILQRIFRIKRSKRLSIRSLWEELDKI